MNKLLNKYKNLSIVTKAALWFTFASILQKGISFITVPIFTRIMTPEQYGLFSVYLSWVSVLTILGGLDFHTCIYINNLSSLKDEKSKNEIAVSLINLSFVITCIWLLIYILAKNFWNSFLGLPTNLVLLMFLEVFFIPVVNLWSTKQRYNYSYKKLVSWTIIQVILNAILGILFVLKVNVSNQATARIFSIAIIQAIFGIVLIIGFILNAKKIFVVKWWKSALQLHLPLLPHSLSLTVLSSADRVMINYFEGTVKTAIYSVAYSASMVINIIKLSITQAMTPWIYECMKNKKYESIEKKSNLVMLLVMFMVFIFILFAPELILLMGSREYYSAIYVIPPVTSSIYFTFLYSMFSTIELYYEKTKEIMYASVSASLLNIILNAIFINIFGFIAAGYTTLVCYIFLSFAHYFFMKKALKEKVGNIKLFDIKFIILMGILVIICSILFSILYSFTIIRYILIVFLTVIAILKRNKIIKFLKVVKEK